jgi:hypothetical protein
LLVRIYLKLLRLQHFLLQLEIQRLILVPTKVPSKVPNNT